MCTEEWMHISCNHDLTILLSVAVHCSTSTQQLCSLTKCTLSACSTHCVFTCHGTITIAPPPPSQLSVCMTKVGKAWHRSLCVTMWVARHNVSSWATKQASGGSRILKRGFQCALDCYTWQSAIKQAKHGSGGIPPPEEKILVSDLLRLFLVPFWGWNSKSWMTYC